MHLCSQNCFKIACLPRTLQTVSVLSRPPPRPPAPPLFVCPTQLISQLESQGLLPVPIFINGVEAHTVVRDLLTSASEQQSLARGLTGGISSTLSKEAVRVDAVISTIGFPLVGGPAGASTKTCLQIRS